MFGAKVLVEKCAKLKAHETALIIVTPATFEVGQEVLKQVKAYTSKFSLVCMPKLEIHGMEPQAYVADAMTQADVIFCLTPMSLAHSQARKQATSNKSRFLSLPDYSMKLLASPTLKTDFDGLIPTCNSLGQILDLGKRVNVKSDLGTEFTFSIKGRAANRCPGIVSRTGELGSPPDAEVNIAPIEGVGDGILIIDGSIPCPGLGLLDHPVELTVTNGRVTNVQSQNKNSVKVIEEMFEKAGPDSRVIGEFGIGLNPNADLCGIMLIDEGCAGTIHFGIGSNATIGGTNNVAFHVDFIMKNPSVTVDEQILIESGNLLV